MSRPNPVDLPDRIVEKTTRSGWTRRKYADGVCWNIWRTDSQGRLFAIHAFISNMELAYARHGRDVSAFKLRDARRKMRQAIAEAKVASM